MTDRRPVSSKPPPDPRIGTVIEGRYRITKRIGEGGMGVVYEAENLSIGRRVAIKSIHPYLLSLDEAIQRFHREARAAAAIGNEHIIDVFDMGVFDDQSPFMVMEYLEGRELETEIEEIGRIDLGRMVRIIGQTCDAIRAAHEKGIVHRDLKPENIFLVPGRDNPDFVKILDFGITKIKDSIGDQEKLTRTGKMIGTPQFMAPEQIERPRSVDHRTDIYAIGVILYYALSGRYPFMADNAHMLIMQICRESPLSLSELVPGIPAEVNRIVMKALEKDPDKRFQDCRDLKEQLWPYRSPTEPPPPIPPKPPVRPRAESKSRRIWLLSAIIFLTFGAGMVVWLVANQPTPRATVLPDQITHEQERGSTVTHPLTEKVKITIATLPIDAELYLDGVRTENPLSEEQPKSNETHRLQIKREGYQTLERQLVFNAPQSLRFELKPVPIEIEETQSVPIRNTVSADSAKAGKKVSTRTSDQKRNRRDLDNKQDIKQIDEVGAASDVESPIDSLDPASPPREKVDDNKPADNADTLLPKKDLIRIR